MVVSRSASYSDRVSDLQDTLDAIDTLAVHCCGYCDEPLAPDSPSPDFCGSYCQQKWTERQAEVAELIGYREPYDLPQHQANQVELLSPETTPDAGQGWTPCTCPTCSRSGSVDLVNITSPSDPHALWAVVSTNPPTAPSEATLGAYCRVMDDMVAVLAWQTGVLPELLDGESAVDTTERYMRRFRLGLFNEPDPAAPRRIIDFGNGS